jgi:hypothetical protein
MTPLRIASLVAVLASLVIVPSAGAASCSSKAKGHFAGLDGTPSINAQGIARECLLAQQAHAGSGVLRQAFEWRYIEHAPGGSYSFGVYDSWVAATARHGIRILPILTNPPAFRAKNTSRHIAPPNSYAAFGRFAAAVVARYGPKGTFWTEHPEVPRRPIRSWQIWNEPNLPQYWGGKPNAKQYTRLLKVAAKAIHKQDKRAEIVTAGLPESLIKHAIQAHRYIPQLYRAGAKKWFTTLAINPYSHSARGVYAIVKRTRRIMLKRHDRAGKLWITEVGWATGGPRKQRFNLGRKGQAKQLKILLPKLYHARKRLKIRGVVWYGWQDLPPYPPRFDKTQWGLYTGLRTLKGRAKPSYKVFARLAPKLR